MNQDQNDQQLKPWNHDVWFEVRELTVHHSLKPCDIDSREGSRFQKSIQGTALIRDFTSIRSGSRASSSELGISITSDSPEEIKERASRLNENSQTTIDYFVENDPLGSIAEVSFSPATFSEAVRDGLLFPESWLIILTLPYERLDELIELIRLDHARNMRLGLRIFGLMTDEENSDFGSAPGSLYLREGELFSGNVGFINQLFLYSDEAQSATRDPEVESIKRQPNVRWVFIMSGVLSWILISFVVFVFITR